MGTSNSIVSLSVNVGAGAVVTLTPPVNEAWLIHHVGSSNAVVAAVPDVEVALTRTVGALTGIIQIDPTTNPGKRTRPLELYVSHGVVLTITNTGGAGAEIVIDGEKVNPFNVLSDVVAVGAGASVAIDPGATYGMRVTEIGYSVWTAGPADINPDCILGATDGVLVAPIILAPTMTRGQDMPLNLYFSHDAQMYITDGIGAAGGNFAYSAVKSEYPVVSTIVDVATVTDEDFIPPDGAEYVATCLGAETWNLAGAPADVPNLIVSLVDGAEVSQLIGNAASPLWEQELKIRYDHDRPLRINNASAGNSEIFVSAYQARGY